MRYYRLFNQHQASSIWYRVYLTSYIFYPDIPLAPYYFCFVRHSYTYLLPFLLYPLTFILLRPSSFILRLTPYALLLTPYCLSLPSVFCSLSSAFCSLSSVCLHLLMYNSTVLCLNCFYARKTCIKVTNNLKNIIFCIRIQNLLLVILRF